ncbi:Rieske 2Fe-2S domain-containing protein [Myxococcota bacterium]|nr:Rieske 2Fe-2S domain-containing protein [Myxococcota bacterium]
MSVGKGGGTVAAEQVLVVDVSDLSRGSTRALEHAGRSILLCNADGEFYAVENRCSHAATPLTRGRLEGCLLECPVHGARFDVRDGAAARRPARRPLNTFSVAVAGNSVEIRVG